MSGGTKINDHSSWIGAGPNGVVCPTGAKMKRMYSVEGAGAVLDYEDTSEKIKDQQEANVRKARSEKTNAMYRN